MSLLTQSHKSVTFLPDWQRALDPGQLLGCHTFTASVFWRPWLSRFIECEFLSVRVHIVQRTEELTAASQRHLFFIGRWRSCRRFVETCWSLLSLSRKCLEVCKEQNYNLSNAANSTVSTQGSISPSLKIVLYFMYF